MERDKIEAALKAAQEMCAERMYATWETERLVYDIKELFWKLLGIHSDRLNVELDVLHGIVNITEVVQPEGYFNLLEGAPMKEDTAKKTDTAPERGGVSEELEAAKRDIAAMIWTYGCCEYCGFGKKDEYCGATRWRCSLEPGAGCNPVWRGIERVIADG